MHKILFFLWLSLILVISSCNDQCPQSPCAMDDSEGSEWLEQMIASLQNDSLKAEIYAYDYKGNTVVEVNGCIDCADFITSVYDCSGIEICRFGGIAGVNTCPEFYLEATNKRLLWKN